MRKARTWCDSKKQTGKDETMQERGKSFQSARQQSLFIQSYKINRPLKVRKAEMYDDGKNDTAKKLKKTTTLRPSAAITGLQQSLTSYQVRGENFLSSLQTDQPICFTQHISCVSFHRSLCYCHTLPIHLFNTSCIDCCWVWVLALCSHAVQHYNCKDITH